MIHKEKQLAWVGANAWNVRRKANEKGIRNLST